MGVEEFFETLGADPFDPGPIPGADLVAELKFARECVAEWAAYASDYFREKWGLDDDLARIDAAIRVHDSDWDPDAVQ